MGCCLTNSSNTSKSVIADAIIQHFAYLKGKAHAHHEKEQAVKASSSDQGYAVEQPVFSSDGDD